jgi:hypothetical protein
MTVLGEFTIRTEDSSDIVLKEQLVDSTVNVTLENDILLNSEYINGFESDSGQDMALVAWPPNRNVIPLEINKHADNLIIMYQDARQSDLAYDIIAYVITEDEPEMI